MKKLYQLSIIALAGLLLTGCGMFRKELSPEEKKQQATIAATLPFGIAIDGKAAVLNNEFCAKIAEPVTDSAEIQVNIQSNDPIVANITPATKQGLDKAGSKPMIIVIDGQTSALDKTFSGKKLKPGKYVMRVNADNKIASILFEVK